MVAKGYPMSQPIVLQNVHLLHVGWNGPEHIYEIEIEGYRLKFRDENSDGTGPFVFSLENPSPPPMDKITGVPSQVVSHFRHLFLKTERSESILEEVKGFLKDKDGTKGKRVTDAAIFDYNGDGKTDALHFVLSDRLLGEITVDISVAVFSDKPVIENGRLIYRKVDADRRGVWLLDIFDPLFSLAVPRNVHAL